MLETISWLITQLDWETISFPSRLLLQSAGQTSGGIDPTTFWLIVSALGGVVSTLASTLYFSEKSRREKAEAKLEKYQEIAPHLAEDVRWLIEEAQRSHGDLEEPLPWPYQRRGPRRPSSSPTRRRRS